MPMKVLLMKCMRNSRKSVYHSYVALHRDYGVRSHTVNCIATYKVLSSKQRCSFLIMLVIFYCLVFHKYYRFVMNNPRKTTK